ncbi:MAG: NADP-dependent oxidoreductase [Solirubrobacterales bacterium]|nr:NADP-dependent oxidoreductase [Solirubrobacterales bacterium]
MRGAGIAEIGGPVVLLELEESPELADDEVLIEVRAAGVGNWDEIVRTGGWDVGTRPPMALGVEAAGVVLATGAGVTGVSPGDGVLTHPVPLRHQGAWAERLVASAGAVATKPETVPWEAAAAFPVPALTAEQALSVALSAHSGMTLLVHGAGGLTGGLIVQLAALRGIDVLATAGASSRDRVRRLGAREVLDRTDPGWCDQARELAGDAGFEAVVNAARGGALSAMSVLADGGRLVTITSDPPAEERGIAVSSLYVRPDAGQLGAMAGLLGEGKLNLPVAEGVGIDDADRALAEVTGGGTSQGAVVIRPLGS